MFLVAERRLGLADRRAALISEPSNPLFVTHSLTDIRAPRHRTKMLVIAHQRWPA
jgi:hypothetical protein